MNTLTPKFSVTFDAEPHTYTHEGRRYPSYSEIVKSEGFGFQGPSGPWTGRGTFLHDCNVAIVDGDLDDDAVPEEWRGYIVALRKAHAELRPTVIACELPLVVPDMGYACTSDMIVMMHGALRGPCEIKSGDITDVGMQLAAQRHAWNVNFPQLPCGDLGWCLSIDAGGGYRLYRHQLAGEFLDFMAVLRVRQRRQRGNPNGLFKSTLRLDQ